MCSSYLTSCVHWSFSVGAISLRAAQKTEATSAGLIRAKSISVGECRLANRFKYLVRARESERYLTTRFIPQSKSMINFWRSSLIRSSLWRLFLKKNNAFGNDCILRSVDAVFKAHLYCLNVLLMFGWFSMREMKTLAPRLKSCLSTVAQEPWMWTISWGCR